MLGLTMAAVNPFIIRTFQKTDHEKNENQAAEMKLYHTKKGILAEKENQFFLLKKNWDEWINDDEVFEKTTSAIQPLPPFPSAGEWMAQELLPPLGSQEVWASGVTYYRSREARMEEAKETHINIEIIRSGQRLFSGQTRIDQIKRSFEELVEYLYRETTFPSGCLLMTGTGIVPPDEFTLHSGDEINITIPPIGTLSNRVE